MEPTLLVGDRLFVTKFSYGYSKHSFPFSPPIFKGRILANEPKNINALFFRGLRALKEGENEIAIENWTLLLDQIPPGSQMALELLKKINNLKK